VPTWTSSLRVASIALWAPTLAPERRRKDGARRVYRRTERRPCPILFTFSCEKGGKPLRAVRCFGWTVQFDGRSAHSNHFPARDKQVGLDLYGPNLPLRPGAKARPGPVFWGGAQAPFDGVAMNVAKLGDKALIVAHIVIEVSGLPERRLAGSPLAPHSRLDGNRRFEHLHEPGKPAASRLAQQQVNVLRHYDVAINTHRESPPRLLKSQKKCALHLHLRQMRKAMIATEGKEVGLAGVMKTLESGGHGVPLYCGISESILPPGFVLPPGICGLPPLRRKKGARMGHGALKSDCLQAGALGRSGAGKGPLSGTGDHIYYIAVLRLSLEGAYYCMGGLRPISEVLFSLCFPVIRCGLYTCKTTNLAPLYDADG
jgi:hypothetical protein